MRTPINSVSAIYPCCRILSLCTVSVIMIILKPQQNSKGGIVSVTKGIDWMGIQTDREREKKAVSEAQADPISELDRLAAQINEAHIALVKRTLTQAMAIGDLINQVYIRLGYQDRGRWLKRHCPQIEARTARVYVQLA